MYIDLTTNVSQNSPLIQWAKSQDNPHIAMGHIGTHLDTYEKSVIPLEYFKSPGILFDVRGIPEVTEGNVDIRAFLCNEVLCVHDPQHQLSLWLFQSLNELLVASFNFLLRLCHRQWRVKSVVEFFQGVVHMLYLLAARQHTTS